jgi:sugar phosphate permease
VGASEGFLGWVAYLGAANAGIPLSIIVKNYGWEVSTSMTPSSYCTATSHMQR